MKVNTLKSLLGILILGSMFNLSCNQNSPAPVSSAAPNTTTATTSKNTPEGLALALVGHWYLDSMVSYSTPTSFTTTLYGFNAVVTSTNGGGAQHYENDLKSIVTATQTPSVTSNTRESYNITWSRNMTNDTISYGTNNSSWVVVTLNSALFLNGGGSYFSGYIGNYTGNNIELAPNTSSLKSGQYFYWHR